ncbi:MAG: FeoB-associated Cys-rich membrane protein [Clostridiales bacterium]|jgi:hypothetical protein|nr:FeoB-associated Cys-rich membrane protein [Clostridiales bacterium]
MNPADIILIAVIAIVLVLAVVLAVRRKKTSPCCSGNCAECVRKNGIGGCGNSSEK